MSVRPVDDAVKVKSPKISRELYYAFSEDLSDRLVGQKKQDVEKILTDEGNYHSKTQKGAREDQDLDDIIITCHKTGTAITKEAVLARALYIHHHMEKLGLARVHPTVYSRLAKVNVNTKNSPHTTVGLAAAAAKK